MVVHRGQRPAGGLPGGSADAALAGPRLYQVKVDGNRAAHAGAWVVGGVGRLRAAASAVVVCPSGWVRRVASGWRTWEGGGARGHVRPRRAAAGRRTRVRRGVPPLALAAPPLPLLGRRMGALLRCASLWCGAGARRPRARRGAASAPRRLCVSCAHPTAAEVELKGSSLNSGDCFLLKVRRAVRPHTPGGRVCSLRPCARLAHLLRGMECSPGCWAA